MIMKFGQKIVNSIIIKIVKIIKFVWRIILCIIVEEVLKSLNLLDIFNKDIKFVSLNCVFIVLAILVMAFMFISILAINKYILSMILMFKKHRGQMFSGIFMLNILVLYKCHFNYEWVTSSIEFLLLYWTAENVMVKVCNYNLKKTIGIDSNFSEKPIVGLDSLTAKQKRAYVQLKKVIDDRQSTDSFNIALIGAWGSGKTSITDTLIYECEKSKEQSYFILKIGVQTLNETRNVVNYVERFFEDLFTRYAVGSFDKNIAFLSVLAKSFGSDISLLKLFGNEETYYTDLEMEKVSFANNVSSLLKRSGKKNILLIIDDVDRCDEEEQIIKLLIEFASIEGIISIISLDKSNDRIIRPTFDNDEKSDVYNALDKYIHIRIRIDEDNHIEYDKRITGQIIEAFINLEQKKNNCYITLNGNNERNSLFECLKDYQTTEIIKKNNHSVGSYNILSELLLCNLKNNSETFGQYFEELVNEFVYNSKELAPYIAQMLSIPHENWQSDLYIVWAQWTHALAWDDFDWLMRLRNNSSTLFFTLLQEMEALENLGNYNKRLDDIKSIEDVYDFWMIEKAPIDGRTWENRKEQPMIYSGLQQVEYIVFTPNEYAELNEKIEVGQLVVAQDIILTKIRGVANLFFLSMVLTDFMNYFRSVLNNYRLLKMQLREAELLNINYFDYLIKDWQPCKDTREAYEQMKKTYPLLSKVNVGLQSLCSFFNCVLFENYILKFGKRFINDELKNGKLFLNHYNGKTKIIISIKEEHNMKYFFMDEAGEIISQNEISEEEIKKIAKKSAEIWGD